MNILVMLKKEVGDATSSEGRERMSDEQIARVRSLGYLSDEESEQARVNDPAISAREQRHL